MGTVSTDAWYTPTVREHRLGEENEAVGSLISQAYLAYHGWHNHLLEI